MIFDKIKKIMMLELSLSEFNIHKDLNLTSDLELLDFMVIIEEIEEEFEIEITDEEILEITTLEELCDFVELKLTSN